MVPLLLEGVAGPFVFAIDAEQKQPLCFERNRGAEKGSVRAGWRNMCCLLFGRASQCFEHEAPVFLHRRNEAALVGRVG